MTDAFFYLGILIFFFVLWVYSGGPNHPISFAGPYITPVTNVGVNSVGYDDSTSNAVHSYFGSYSGNYSSTKPTPTPTATVTVPRDTVSPSNSLVHIGLSNPQGSTPSTEYVSVRNDGSADVTVTGWKIIDAVNKNGITIPSGSRDQNGSTRPVILSPGQSVVVSTGSTGSTNTTTGSWYAYLNVNHDLWNDRNDTLTLLDANGTLVDQYRY